MIFPPTHLISNISNFSDNVIEPTLKKLIRHFVKIIEKEYICIKQAIAIKFKSNIKFPSNHSF